MNVSIGIAGSRPWGRQASLGCRPGSCSTISILRPQRDNIGVPTTGPDLGSDPKPHQRVLLHFTSRLRISKGQLRPH